MIEFVWILNFFYNIAFNKIHIEDGCYAILNVFGQMENLILFISELLFMQTSKKLRLSCNSFILVKHECSL
jgi:hypothetical protein